MALKSRINIEVDKGQFEESLSAFNKYQEALKKVPGEWAYYHHRIEGVNATAKELSSFLEANNIAMGEAVVQHDRFSEAAAKASKVFSKLSADVKHAAERVGSLVTSLFQFSLITGLMSGLLGSGFGVYVLDRTAAQVMDRRRSALGMGVSYGALQSFSTNFSRFGIGQEALGAVSTGAYDFTSPQYRALVAGAGVISRDPAKSAVELLKRLPALFAGTPDDMVGPRAKSLGLTDVLSVQQIVAYLRASNDERNAQIAAFQKDKGAFEIPPDAAKKWSDFAVQVEKAGVQIENILANMLVPLAPSITHLSERASAFIDALANSGAATKAIDTVSEGLSWFAGEVNSPEAREAGKLFLSGLEQLSVSLASWGRFLVGPIKAAWDLFTGNPSWKQLGRDLLGPDGAPDSPPPQRSTYPRASIRHGTWGGPGTIPGRKNYPTSPMIDSGSMTGNLPGERLSNDYSGVNLNSDESVGGGSAEEAVIDLARGINQTEGHMVVRAFNDRMHHGLPYHSAHTEGRALDAVMDDIEGAKVRTKRELDALGLNENEDYWIEWNAHNHLHVQFNGTGAAKYWAVKHPDSVPGGHVLNSTVHGSQDSVVIENHTGGSTQADVTTHNAYSP